MILAKGNSCKQMAILPFIVSVVVLTSAIRSETGADDRTSAVLNPKTDSTIVNIPCCASDIAEGDVQVRLKRSLSTPDVEEIASWKGSSSPKLKPGQRSEGKESHSDTKLRWQRTGVAKNDKSHDNDQVERERNHLEEVLEVRGNGGRGGGGGVSQGKWIAKEDEPSSIHGLNPSAESSVDNTTESNGKRLGSRNNHGGEQSRGINRFLSVGWSSKPKSALQDTRDNTGSSSNGSHRTRRDLRALKRMLQDAGIAAPVNDVPEEFPEEGEEEDEEERPEMTDEEQEMYEDNVEVPQMGEALSGEATRRQDFSKRPKYYPDWGPKRTWRINMMRVWGKRHLAGYDRNHDVSRWENY